MNRTTTHVTGLAVVFIAGALALAGCSNSDGTAALSETTTTSSATDKVTHNPADVAFATNMRAHHEGALAMSALADTRAADPRVKDLAARIKAAQQPEIDKMTGWLDAWGADASSTGDSMGDMPGMDHGSTADSADMPGMDMSGMTQQDMAALTAATGADFDRLFLKKMSEHHAAAVTMAKDEIQHGKNAEAIAMAVSIRDSQTAQIAEMQQLLTAIGD